MTMPFGKWRGVELEDLPDHYIHWLRSLPDLRDPLRTGIEGEWAKRFEPEWDGPQEDFVQGLDAEEFSLLKLVIQAGYRSLSIKLHPDLVGGDGREMRELNALMEKLRGALAA
jgi:Putative quorum-sensing-regulated virulence factor